MYKFKFIEDVGRICYVCAQTRKKAIEIYCNEKNCNEEYVKKHCKIENWGKFLKNEQRTIICNKAGEKIPTMY